MRVRRTGSQKSPHPDDLKTPPTPSTQPQDEPLLSLRALVLLTIAASAASLTTFFPEIVIPASVGIALLTLLDKTTRR